MTNNTFKIIKRRSNRDARGRFMPGNSGNPNGRPRKQPDRPWSLEASMRRELAKVVPVSAPDGSVKDLAMRDLFVTKFLTQAVMAKPRDQLVIIMALAKMNLLSPTDEESAANEQLYSEEDRRILKKLAEEVFPHEERRPTWAEEASARQGANE